MLQEPSEFVITAGPWPEEFAVKSPGGDGATGF
jgi:hypothetical protein